MRANEVINLSEAKHALRVAGSYDDELILGLICQAESFAAKYMGRGFALAPLSALKPALLLHISHMYEGHEGVPRASLEFYNQYKIMRI